MSSAVWLEAAINGPWSRDYQPGIPVQADEIVADALACAEAGAAIASGLDNLQREATNVAHDGNLGWVVGNETIELPVYEAMITGTGNYVVV